MESKTLKFERIDWWDHSSWHNNAWRDYEEHIELKPILIESNGYVIKETKKYVLLMPHISESGNMRGEICILKNCIKNRKEIK